MMIFTIHSLPATYGDCFIVEYGESANTISRLLIDGGTSSTSKSINTYIQGLDDKKVHFELAVVTHVDRDHIEGVLSLLEKPVLNFSIGDFWFNGWRHLNEDVQEFGPDQGERLSAAILAHNIPWNQCFHGKAVVIEDGSAKLPKVKLPGGMVLTLLSPLRSNLISLIPKWKSDVEEAGLEPGYGEIEYIDHGEVESFGATMPSTDIEYLIKQPFKEDDALANGSSIAFLAEFAGKKVLFAGDSFPSVVLKSLEVLAEGKVEIDFYKLSHHGSKGNTSPDLIRKLNCHKFLISTNGSNYGHPNDVTVARVIKLGGKQPELIFNYESEFNLPWNDDDLKNEFEYRTVYPKGPGMTVRLLG